MLLSGLPGHVQPAITLRRVPQPYGTHAQGVLAGAYRERRRRGPGLHASHLRAGLAAAEDDDGEGGRHGRGHGRRTAPTPGLHQAIIDGRRLPTLPAT